MELPKTKVKFIVGLSNGETLMEGKGILSEIEGEDSAWHKLMKYIQENGLEITSMSLQTKSDIGNRHYHLPNEKGKFGGLVPISFNCFRKVISEEGFGESLSEFYTCAEATYENFKVQLYVSERDCDKCWVNIVKK